MLRELLALLKFQEPKDKLMEDFVAMLTESGELVHKGSAIYFGKPATETERRLLKQQDRQVNKLERGIRKRVLLSLTDQPDGRNAPSGLALMSLVKDVERIGDYSKGLAALTDFATTVDAADDELAGEMAKLVEALEEIVGRLPAVMADSDQTAAIDLVRSGREMVGDFKKLLQRIAVAEREPRAHSALLLGAQYYLRILAHSLNVLTVLVTPLHRIDYYEDKDMLKELKEGE